MKPLYREPAMQAVKRLRAKARTLRELGLLPDIALNFEWRARELERMAPTLPPEPAPPEQLALQL